jgi:hypothetical protein
MLVPLVVFIFGLACICLCQKTVCTGSSTSSTGVIVNGTPSGGVILDGVVGFPSSGGVVGDS